MKYPEVFYEDQEVAVCRKEFGIPVQTAKTGQQDMVSLLRNYFAQKQEPSQIFVVHRLDQPVEGIMVFARTKGAAASLSRQMQEKTIEKEYLALVEGMPEPGQGTLEDYLVRDGRNNLSCVAAPETPHAKKAVLSYRVEEVRGALSLVRIRLETGRHHQIRVQMAHFGHPLAGDKKYNSNCGQSYRPIGLCSVHLSFAHPGTGKKMTFEIAPKGKAFEKENVK